MEEYEELREEHYAGQEERHYLPFEKASSKRKGIDFEKRPPVPPPNKPGITVVTGSYELDDVLDYIDWNPFFQVRNLGVVVVGVMVVFVAVAVAVGGFAVIDCIDKRPCLRSNGLRTGVFFAGKCVGVFLGGKCRMSTSSRRLRVVPLD